MRKLAEVSGVARIDYDIEPRIIRMAHRPVAAPSRRVIREVVEKGGKGNGKASGPGGTFARNPEA